jgi:hypothetical protein
MQGIQCTFRKLNPHVVELGVPDLQFDNAARAEHCSLLGSDFQFETSNYHIRTTAKREWGIVVDGEPLSSDEAAHGRQVPDLQALEQLSLTVEANLSLIEIIALVLYTGPMVSRLQMKSDVCDLDFLCLSSWSTIPS